VNVGLGYAPGEAAEIVAGVKLALSVGSLNDGDSFTVQALADTDTSGFLAAAGLNTFFTGNSAATIAVRQEIMSQPGLIACSQGLEGQDNGNILRMSRLADAEAPALNGMTPPDFYHDFVAGIGEAVSTAQNRRQHLQNVLQHLTQQRDKISGVDVNVEAAKLLVFERLYQGMAKFLSVEDQAIGYLMELV
jgi:flagellar hook-associated protein 1 FlgK